MENKKARVKNYYQTNKEKVQERSTEYYINFFKDEKKIKRNYANNRTKNMSDEGRKRKKICTRCYYHKRENYLLFN